MAELECVKEDLWLLILPWRNTEPTSVISQGWERSNKRPQDSTNAFQC